jgi:RES domain
VYWRVFPWDAAAAAGEKFSPSFVPRPTGLGRFDLPVDLSPVRYLAESPEHAVAEALQPWRNSRLSPYHLELDGRRLALVQVTIVHALTTAIVDLCDPRVLGPLATRPDLVASRHRDVTQSIARRVWEAGRPGLRWWSCFSGDWHTTVLFTGRASSGTRFSRPEHLEMDSPALQDAAGALGMKLVA